MAPKLYTLDWSPPVRATLLTEKALGLQLEHVHTDLMVGAHLTPEYLKLNPQHTIPTLVDDDGTVIADSHAIMCYMVDKFGENDDLYPKNLAERAVVNSRLYFECGVVFSALKRIVRGFREGLKEPADEALVVSKDAYDVLNKYLDGEQWVAGKKITIADFSLISSVLSLHQIVPIDAKHTNIFSWIKRMEQLPYYDANSVGLENFKVFLKALREKNQ